MPDHTVVTTKLSLSESKPNQITKAWAMFVNSEHFGGFFRAIFYFHWRFYYDLGVTLREGLGFLLWLLCHPQQLILAPSQLFYSRREQQLSGSAPLLAPAADHRPSRRQDEQQVTGGSVLSPPAAASATNAPSLSPLGLATESGSVFKKVFLNLNCMFSFSSIMLHLMIKYLRS